VAKNSTFCRAGFLAGHDGRQKIRVVRTAARNTPSNEASLATSARYIAGGAGRS
jgi:hypothetical protein